MHVRPALGHPAASQLSLELQAQPEFCPMWTQASPGW